MPENTDTPDPLAPPSSKSSSTPCSGSFDTPETDAECLTVEDDGTAIFRDWIAPDFARKLERERNAMCAGIRDLRDACGLNATIIACRHLYSLLPENKEIGSA